MQWRTFPSVSVHRPIKITKDRLSQLPSGPWSDKNTVLVVSCPTVFMVLQTTLLLYPNKIQASVQHKRQTCWPVHLNCRGTMFFDWSKWPCVVHGQSAWSFFFVGSIVELKVNSWSEATLQQVFQDWVSVMWTSTFVHNRRFFLSLCKSGVLLFLLHWDTVFS